jgi:two-component system, NtrC family, sensor kinase
MKVVQKLTLAMIMGMLIVLGGNGYFRVRREVALFRSDRVRDHKLVGLALGAAVAAMWRSDGEAAARAMLDQANMREDKIGIRLVDAPEISLPRAELDALGPGESVTHLVQDDRGRPTRRTWVPVAVDSSRAGVLELSETLDVERGYVGTTLLDTALMTALLAGVCAAFSAGLGAWLVGRPMASLAEKARRVGRGDFSGPIVLGRRDEMGELAAEMNAMCDRLVEARAAVAAQAAARIAVLEQLRHADRLMTVGKLASGIAHELGTPLNVIEVRAGMIADGEAGGEEARSYARAVVEASEQMTRIVRQLLDFARPRGPERSAEDVRGIARRTLALLEPLAAKRGVALALREGPAAVAEVDAGQIQQVLTNLVANAIQAMTGPGEVEIAVERTRASPPAGSGGEAGEHVVVRVRDAGRGVAAEDLPHVFEPFFTTKDVGQGTGLGLSVAYGIVREHGGFMDVESEPGEGSVFSVYLPAKEP